jgi:hypothetical protein
MKPPSSASKPWFRHPEPWLLFAAPIAAVVAGSITWWIAAHTNNSLVVDDYYKQGKAINQTLARDQRSAEFGLRATLTVDRASQTAFLRLTASSSSVVLPDAIRVQWIHATRSELDHQHWLRRASEDRWQGAFAVPAEGRWQIQIDDGAGQWRLMRMVSSFAEPIVIIPQPGPSRSSTAHSTAEGS